MNLESRIAELEAKISLAEDLLDTLNLTVYRQQERIEGLQRQLAGLARQYAATGSDGDAGAAEQQIPPHY